MLQLPALLEFIFEYLCRDPIGMACTLDDRLAGVVCPPSRSETPSKPSYPVTAISLTNRLP